MNIVSYEQAVDYISRIPKFTKKNEAGNTKELLRRLSHPEREYRVIHVAGTNGKGSVCAFLESIFRRAGYRTGLFTSPHLVRINERFQTCMQDPDAGRVPISDEDFLDAFSHVMRAVEEMMADGYCHPTYFEFLFAAGMWYFRKQKIDLLLCETGLGGRLDATNTIEKPLLSVITSISLDHTEYLGDTVAKIAAEKAGIIKPGVPVVYDASDPEAAQVIRERAYQTGSAAIAWTPEMSVITGRTDCSVQFRITAPGFDDVPVMVPCAADYQAENASVAMIAARMVSRMDDRLAAEHPVSLPIILEGIAKTRWSGRMEEVLKDVILDGAHNEDGIRQFLKTAERIAERRPVSLLFSAVADKNWKEMIGRICRSVHFRSVTVTSVGGSRQISTAELAEEFRLHAGCPVYAIKDVRSAFKQARRVQGDSVLLCCGSLYLAGAVEEEINNAELRGRTQEISSEHGCK